MIVAVATAIAMPLGTLVAVYLREFAGPEAARKIRLWLDLMNGLPSIVIGLFVFGLLVKSSFLGFGHPERLGRRRIALVDRDAAARLADDHGGSRARARTTSARRVIRSEYRSGGPS